MKAHLDHVGIAVRDLDAALAFYRDALGLEVEASEEVASQRVRAHFIPAAQLSASISEICRRDGLPGRAAPRKSP